MNPIEWSDAMTVGVDKLDRQHHQIIKVINHLLADESEDEVSETVTDALTQLTQYSREHFETEEAMLIDAGFEAFAEHKALHLGFIRRIAELNIAAFYHRRDVPDDLLHFLRQWWVDHIMDEDMQYSSLLTSNQGP